MLSALFAEQAATVDVHAFTQDFIQAFTNDTKLIDTTSCYKSSILVDDEITREDGIADCLAPKLSSQIVEEIVEEPVDFDRNLARIATGVWYIGGTFPEIAAAYKGCDELD